MVVYASPAFYKYCDLWNAIDRKTLVQNTNFVEVHALHKHSKYSYISGGNEGFAHSEPEPIRGTQFLKRLDELRKRDVGQQTNKERIIKWGEDVDSVAMESKIMRENYSGILKAIGKIVELRLAVAFLRLEVFCFLSNTCCFFGYDKNSH